MLLELNVHNLGIIENTRWQLETGLNVITGETGAGKSLIIDALETLLGERTGDEKVRYGNQEAMVEGVFSLPSTDTLTTIDEILLEKNISIEDDILIITCTIRSGGRAVFRINGQAVPRSVISKIGKQLVDIYGQSEHLALLNQKYHLKLLDAFGDNMELLHQFNDKLGKLHEIERELEVLIRDDSNRAKREDLLTFQIAEIRKADLHEDEDNKLEQERQILSSTEKLKSLSHAIYETLSGEQGNYSSIIDQLHKSSRELKELTELDPRMIQQANHLQEMVYNIEEISRDILSYTDTLEYDPERLAEVEDRLNLIRNLKRKYGESVDEIIQSLDIAEKEIAKLSSSTERRTELKELRNVVKNEMGQIASRLSDHRKQTSKSLVEAVILELAELSMSHVSFDLNISALEGEEKIPLPSGQEQSFGSDGIDSVEFMASTNPGEPLKPLAKIASTGEISRFMLALKSVLSQADDIPVVVFDEIDIGVGGRGGEILGKKLWTLGRNRQVICITHLPQIAAFADAHFCVRKEFGDERTSSILKRLEVNSQLPELAAMLSGPDFSETALESIREMMEETNLWKSRFINLND